MGKRSYNYTPAYGYFIIDGVVQKREVESRPGGIKLITSKNNNVAERKHFNISSQNNVKKANIKSKPDIKHSLATNPVTQDELDCMLKAARQMLNSSDTKSGQLIKPGGLKQQSDATQKQKAQVREAEGPIDLDDDLSESTAPVIRKGNRPKYGYARDYFGRIQEKDSYRDDYDDDTLFATVLYDPDDE